MQHSTVSLSVMNPRAEVASVREVRSSARLGSLAGKRIGILYNAKVGADLLLPQLEKSLKAQIPDITLRTWTVPGNQAENLKGPKLKEIADYSDGVIALLGD